MASDFSIKQGDSSPILSDTLTYSDGTPVQLTSATVTFVMKGNAQSLPVVQAPASILNATTGQVAYQFTAANTAIAGEYEAEWIVAQAGTQMTFPTVGYMTITVEANLSTAGANQIVSVAEVHDYLNLQPIDRVHDNKLTYFINSATEIAEDICGSLVTRTYNEWYDGGHHFIVFRHRPASFILACDIYIGPIQYSCQVVSNPVGGTIYSVMLEPDGRRLVRRGPGGGIIDFPHAPQAVHVVYQAGRSTIPWTVRHGVLELIRLQYQPTQQAARGRLGGGHMGGDELESSQPNGFYVPGNVRELFGPYKRAPRVA